MTGTSNISRLVIHSSQIFRPTYTLYTDIHVAKEINGFRERPKSCPYICTALPTIRELLKLTEFWF
jgi:hypothetical protein